MPDHDRDRDLDVDRKVIIRGTDVLKVSTMADPDWAHRQIGHLASASAIGLHVPALLGQGVMPDGRTWALWTRIVGPTMAECTADGGELTICQRTQLARIQWACMSAGLYVGDLNRRNLIWTDNGWTVIDCGATRPKSVHEIRARLRAKWRLQ